MHKIFNIRTGLIVMFTLLLGSYAVLAFIYVNNIYEASTASPTPPVDVIVQDVLDDGSTIKVPDTITVGEPFTYSISGEKLVDAPATIMYQLDCRLVGSARQITSLGSISSDSPKGRFNVTRAFVIPSSTRLSSSDDCYFESVANYTFYVQEKDGSTRTFTVPEQAKSKSFKLVVPTQPAQQPAS